MIGIDANILLRLIVKDDPRQTIQADKLLDESRASSETLFITDVALCETIWVLQSGYDHKKPAILEILHDLIESADFDFRNPESIRLALKLYGDGKADFSDYLIGTRCTEEGCRISATFDKALAKEKGWVIP